MTPAISEVHDTILANLDEQDFVKLATLIRMGALAFTPLVNVQIPAVPTEHLDDARHQDQPYCQGMWVNKTHAIIRQSDFDALGEYSCTDPTGVWPGRMWKRKNGVYDQEFMAAGGQPYWQLCWYGYCLRLECAKPCAKHASINRRRLIVI